MKKILVGAVAYAPQIVPIWDTIREYANDYFKDIRLDYVLFSNYEAQVHYLVEGKIDIAWNTNVAYVRSIHAAKGATEAILMRDTDIGFKSVFVCKNSSIKDVKELGGKRFGLGSLDSAQAAIMPLFYLNRLPLKLVESSSIDDKPKLDSVNLIRFNSDLGKHGDTGKSEFDVLDSIRDGKLDAGAIGSTTWARIMQEGNYPQMTSFYMSEDYCHCNFTVLKSLDNELKQSFITMMQSQNNLKNDPKIAHMMSLEGLNKWVLCDEAAIRGYDDVSKAMELQNLMELKY